MGLGGILLKKKRWKKIIFVYFFALHALLLVMLMKSDFINKVKKKFNIPGSSELSVYYHEVTNHHFRMDDNLPDRATVFIGDSITQGLAVAAVADASVNYGVGGDTTLGVLHRVKKYRSLSRAKTVVLAVGVNDLKFRSDQEIIKNFREILANLPDGLPVVISSVLPVDERVRGKRFQNERISIINQELLELTRTLQHVTFVDANPLLKGKDQNLKTEFHTGDGIHLSAMGYQVWIQVLKQALVNLHPVELRPAA